MMSTSNTPTVSAVPDTEGRAKVRPRMTRRRFLRDLSSVLMLSGLLLVIDAGLTLVWQEPVTAAIGLIERSQVDTRYLNQGPLSTLDQHALGGLTAMSERIAYLARLERRRAPTGAAIGKIAIPRLGASFNVIQGTDTASLERGPGHYPDTAFPGLSQTVAVAGHRTTYLAPFRHIDDMRANDRIVVTMPYGRFTYVVQKTQVVLPTSVWVTRNVGYERLVLSACHPLYSASHRFIVFARLLEVQPLGAARGA
jgi:sortase A